MTSQQSSVKFHFYQNTCFMLLYTRQAFLFIQAAI